MTVAPLRHFAPWLVLLVACFTEMAAAADNFTLNARPAWNGYVKPGVVSELGLRLVTSQRTIARVTLQSSAAQVTSTAQTEPGIPTVVYLPLLHEDSGPVNVELHIDDHLVLTQEVALHVLPGRTRLAVIVEGLNSPNSKPPWDSDNTTTEYLRVSELPRLGQSYGMLAALWLSGSVLEAMDSVQQQALREYLGACGMMYVSAVSSVQEKALRSDAGCSGRSVVNYVSEAGANSPQSAVRHLPGAASLRQLFPTGQGRVFRSLLVFFVAYVLLLLINSRLATSSVTILALPPAATLLALIGWSLGAPETRLSSWAEMDSGDSVARLATLLNISGGGRKQIDVSLPRGFGFPVSHGKKAEAVHLLARDLHGFDLRLDTQLMSRHEFLSTTVLSVPPIEIEDHTGVLRITNHGATPTESGTAVWQGQPYPVPGLSPGEEWQPSERAEPWGQSPEEQMLRQRSADDRSWLLLPFKSPFREMANRGDSAAWILIRGDQGA